MPILKITKFTVGDIVLWNWDLSDQCRCLFKIVQIAEKEIDIEQIYPCRLHRGTKWWPDENIYIRRAEDLIPCKVTPVSARFYHDA